MVGNAILSKYLIELRDELDEIIESLSQGRMDDQEKNNSIEHASQIGQRLAWIRDKIHIVG